MNWLDLIVIVVVAGAAFGGLRTGFIRVVVAVVGFGIAIAVASRFYSHVTPFYDNFIGSDNGARVAAFLTLFVVVLVGTAAAGYLLWKIVTALLRIGWVDRLAGVLLGVVIAFAVLSTFLVVVQAFPVLGLGDTISGSFLGSFLVDQFHAVLRGIKLLPDELTL